MGNICANASLEPEECTSTVDTFKNAVQWQVTLGGCAVSLILGTPLTRQAITSSIVRRA